MVESTAEAEAATERAAGPAAPEGESTVVGAAEAADTAPEGAVETLAEAKRSAEPEGGPRSS